MYNPSLKSLTEMLVNPAEAIKPQENVFLRKLAAGSILFFADLVVLSATIFITLIARDNFLPGDVDLNKYLDIFPLILLLFPAIFYLRGLYPGFGIDVIEELRILTYSITFVFAILATLSFLVKDAWEYSRIAFILSWGIAVLTVPMGRALVRKMFSHKSWWGVPVIIIGAGNSGEQVIKSLKKHPQIGLRPIVAIDDNSDKWGYIENVPVVGGMEVIPQLVNKLDIEQAIIAMPNASRSKKQEIIQTYSKYFKNTTFIPDLYGISSLWVSSKDLGGIVGLEVQQKLLKKSSQIRKRIFDIVLATTLSILALPLIIIIAILIKIDSRGKVFFKQERMGKGDSRFNIVKFRTMHYDAEKRLSDLLAKNKELKAEYEVYHKMKNDPRLTRVGRFLRKYSLDELPQFWNVIKGEMSLIGPRAYMPWEKYKMNGHEEMILKVKPGISGLWQVTDRNASSFEERNSTDVYYIRNWSMFLDIYIVARTIAVVLSGKGAY